MFLLTSRALYHGCLSNFSPHSTTSSAALPWTWARANSLPIYTRSNRPFSLHRQRAFASSMPKLPGKTTFSPPFCSVFLQVWHGMVNMGKTAGWHGTETSAYTLLYLLPSPPSSSPDKVVYLLPVCPTSPSFFFLLPLFHGMGRTGWTGLLLSAYNAYHTPHTSNTHGLDKTLAHAWAWLPFAL